MAEIVEPMHGGKVDIVLRLRFAPPPSSARVQGGSVYRPARELVEALFVVVFELVRPYLEVEGLAYHGRRGDQLLPHFFVQAVPEVADGGSEGDLEAHRAEDLVHEHVGALEVVGGKEVELALGRVRVDVVAVVSEASAWVFVVSVSA